MISVCSVAIFIWLRLFGRDMDIIAVITDPEEIRNILKHLAKLVKFSFVTRPVIVFF